MENSKYLNKLLLTVKFMEELTLMPVNVKLSQTEFRMLREIIIEKELGKQIISSELSRRLGITRSAVSQLVTKLEERGVVKRVASPTDRKIFTWICRIRRRRNFAGSGNRRAPSSTVW